MKAELSRLNQVVFLPLASARMKPMKGYGKEFMVFIPKSPVYEVLGGLNSSSGKHRSWQAALSL